MKNKNENEIISGVIVNMMDVFTAVTLEGKSKNKTSLVNEDADFHVERAHDHIDIYAYNQHHDMTECDTEQHLGHALWRIAVALYKKDKGKSNTNAG